MLKIRATTTVFYGGQLLPEDTVFTCKKNTAEKLIEAGNAELVTTHTSEEAKKPDSKALRKEDLIKLAEINEVEVDAKANKDVIYQALVDAGVIDE